MNRDDIEKAATLYAEDVCKGPQYRWGYEQVAMADFIEGAKWRINIVWHDVSERPNEEEPTIIEFGNGDFSFHNRGV